MLNGPQAGTVASLVLVWTLATAALALRMVARRMTRIHMWADDYFCIAAYTLCTANNAWQLVCKTSRRTQSSESELLDLGLVSNGAGTGTDIAHHPRAEKWLRPPL